MLNDPNRDKKPVLNETSLWLLKAADYIEKYGWWDGSGRHYAKPHQSACMVQALALTSNNGIGVFDIIGKVEKFLDTNLLHRWNDNHSKEECIKALRDCAHAQEIMLTLSHDGNL